MSVLIAASQLCRYHWGEPMGTGSPFSSLKYSSSVFLFSTLCVGLCTIIYFFSFVNLLIICISLGKKKSFPELSDGSLCALPRRSLPEN